MKMNKYEDVIAKLAWLQRELKELDETASRLNQELSGSVEQKRQELKEKITVTKAELFTRALFDET